MALLAHIAFPNAAWPAAYELTNTLSAPEVEQIHRALVAEEPRSELPPKDRPWGDFPAFLRKSGIRARRRNAMAPSK